MFQQFFHQSVSALLLCDTIALFRQVFHAHDLLSNSFQLSVSISTIRAVTVGVIGGKTRAYLPMAYGMSTFNLGLTFFLDAGDDYGTDPRGFIGWEDQTKTVFFVGILSTTGVQHTFFCGIINFNIFFVCCNPGYIMTLFSKTIILNILRISRRFFHPP